MKTKIGKFGAGLMALALAFAGTGAYGAVTTQAELNAAVAAAQAGDVVEITAPGTYKMPSIPQNITIKAASGVAVKIDATGSGNICGTTAGATFEGLEFSFGGSNYHGFQSGAALVFNDCTLNGLFFSYNAMTFNNCTFNSAGTDYCMWCYAGNIVYSGCTFNGQGKFLNLYNEGNGTWSVKCEDCLFISTKANKAALNVKDTCGSIELPFCVTVNNCRTQGLFPPAAALAGQLLVLDPLVQVDDIKEVPAEKILKEENNLNITMDGEQIYPVVPQTPVRVDTKNVEVKDASGNVITDEKATAAVQAIAAEMKNLDVANTETGLDEAVQKESEDAVNYLAISLKGIQVAPETGLSTVTYEVKPMVKTTVVTDEGKKTTTEKIANEKINEPVSFKLPVATFAGTVALVSHFGDDGALVEGYVTEVKGSGDGKYVELQSQKFSTFTLADAVEISGGFYRNVAETEYYVLNLAGLEAFRDSVNGGTTYAGKTVYLENDVDFAGASWEKGIGGTFKGTFDGQGAAIKNLKISAVGNNVGLFTAPEGVDVNLPAIIRNLTLVAPQIETVPPSAGADAQYVGAFCGGAKWVTIENCAVSGGKISCVDQVGGIIGFGLTTTVKDCTLDGVTIEAKGDRAGGIISKAQYGCSISGNTIKNCTITSAGLNATYCGASAIVAQMWANNVEGGGLCSICDNTIVNTTTMTGADAALVPIGNSRDGLVAEKCEFFRNHWEPDTSTADSRAVKCDVGGVTTRIEIANFNPVAQIAGKGLAARYETIQAAIDAAEAGDTVQLLCDVENAGTVTIPGAVTFKTNGKKLTATNVTLASVFSAELTGLKENTLYYVMLYNAAGSWCDEVDHRTQTGETSFSVFKAGTSAVKCRVYDEDWNLVTSVSYSLLAGTLLVDSAGTVEFSGTMANTGTIAVDMTGAEAAVCKLADCTGATFASYGAKGVGYRFQDNAANGYALQTLDGDLYAYKGATASKATLAVKSEWIGTAFGEAVTLGDVDYVYGVNAFGNFEDLTAGISEATTGIVVNGEEFALVGNGGIKTFSNTSGETMTISTVGAAKSSWPESCNGTYLTIGTRTDEPQDYVLAEGSDLTVFQFYTEANENVTFRIDGALKAEGSILLKDYSSVTVGKTGTLTLDGSSRPQASGTNFHDWGLLTVEGVLNLGLRDFNGWRVQIGDDGYNNDGMELNVVGGTVNVYSVENATGVEKYSTKDPAVTLVGGWDPVYDSTPATLSVSAGGAYVTEGTIVNHGLVAIFAGTNGVGRASQIVADVFDGEHGMVLVDMTGATEKSYKLIDAAAASDYGTYQFAEGKDCGYMLSVVDNDLVAVKAVAQIGESKFLTLLAAMQAASQNPGTAENPTVVQLYPGVVQEGNITPSGFALTHVVFQGAPNLASSFKNCQIAFQGSYSCKWTDVAFKGILWDNAKIVFTTFPVEGLTLDGNKFVGMTNCGAESNRAGVHFTSKCTDLTYVNNVFDTSTGSSLAAINTANSKLTGNVTITNNVFKNSCWRSLQLMFDAGDGIADTFKITDNWFSNNKYGMQVVPCGTNTDAVDFTFCYNVVDDGDRDNQTTLNGFDLAKSAIRQDHNYFFVSPDEHPDYFYLNAECTADNVYNAGVYPYYNAYHKDELAAGTMTVRESLYNLVQPGAVIVKANGNVPVYANLAAALEASAAGDRVKMLVASDAEVVLKAGVTFDANGMFLGTVTAEDGSILKDNGDGTFTALTAVAAIGETKYATLAEAIAAVQNGETVKVLKSGNVVTDYAKQIGEDGYGEGAGANRLVFGTDPAKPFTLDLNGLTLAGRLNVTSGVMTVANGTLRASSQAVNIFGTMDLDYTNKVWTSVTIAADTTVRSDTYGLCVFAGDPNNSYYPFGFGEVFNVYGKVYAFNPLNIVGNVGNCQNKYDASNGYPGTRATAYIAGTLGMTYGEVMRNFGPKITIYDGAVLESTEDGGQGVSIQGCGTVNVLGGTITGNEAIGVKGGFLNVYGGKLTAVGQKWDPVTAVNSGTEQSGAAIAVTTYYQTQNPIAVNVAGGQMQSLNNSAMLVAHSYSSHVPTAASLGVAVSVAGGTFIGAKDGQAIYVEPAIAGEEGKYPANFISPEMNGEAETGYPLCSSRIPANYIALGYVEKDNQNGTWTVTAGSPEIKTVTQDVEVIPTQVGEVEVTDAEKLAAANEVKDDIVKAMEDPEVSDLVGTGLKDNVFEFEGGNPVLKDDVVTQLREQAVADKKAKILADLIAGGTSEAEAQQTVNGMTAQIADEVNAAITKNSSSNTESHVEVKLQAVEVAVSKESTESAVVEATLTKVTFDVKPIVTVVTTIGDVKTTTTIELKNGAELENPVLVRLWLNKDFLGTVVKVTHKHEGLPDEVVSAIVQTGVNEMGETRKFVEVTWKYFSLVFVESLEYEGKTCLANGNLYESVQDALNDMLPEDATIVLLADCSEANLPLGANRTIKLNDFAFTGSLAAVDGKEMVKARSGEVYYAPTKVNVPVGTGSSGMPIRGYEFPGTVADTEEAKVAHLVEVADNGNLRWQNYALFGNGAASLPKLIPEVVGALEGFSQVKIQATDAYRALLHAPAKGGVGVKFQLMRSDTSPTTGFALVGEPKDEPVFSVDVTDVGAKTYWKIQTIFGTTEYAE